MNTEIVRYNQALDLMELGFNSTCANLYYGQDLITQSHYDNYINGLCDDDENIINAPTLHQANQWLLDNKHWYVHPIPIWTIDTCETYWTLSLYNLDTCQEYCYMYQNKNFNETLSYGIDRVLDILLRKKYETQNMKVKY